MEQSISSHPTAARQNLQEAARRELCPGQSVTDALNSIACDSLCEALPRAMIVVAHPDDEVVALGGRLERFRESIFIHVTDGAPQDGADARAYGFHTLKEYRDARTAELARAMRDAGISEDRSHTFSVPDQRASWSLVPIAKRIAEHIRAYSPQCILTHPYEGGHPDHDACAFAVDAAVRLCGNDIPVIEATFYHAGPNGIATGCFLPQDAHTPCRRCVLSSAERERKLRRLACFATQRTTLQWFGADVESFRVAPPYDFSRAPHPGTLFYENFPWGMSGKRFRELVHAATAELELRPWR